MPQPEIHRWRRSTLVLFCLLLITVLAVHLKWTDATYHITRPANAPYEGPGAPVGSDFAYYLWGTLSLREFEIEKKFNNKPWPVLEQKRPIVHADMPDYAKYALIFYPHTSFKFGFSLTAAALTFPFSDTVFLSYVPRLVFTNIVLAAGLVLLVFLSLNRLCGSPWPGFMAALFVIFDYSLIHNSYAYQTHTTAGLFYLSLGFYLFTASEIGLWRSFTIAAIYSFAAVTSSHIYPHLLVVGGLMYLYTVAGRPLRTWIRCAAASAAGALLWPAYIVGVEQWFHFHALGLPTYFEQQIEYVRVVKTLMFTVPLSMRFIWDIRIFNFFWPAILLLLITGLGYAFWRQRPRIELDEAISRPESKVLILFAALVLALATTGFASQPLSRSATPNTVLFGILVGYGFGKLCELAPRLGAVASSGTVAMLIINFMGLSYIQQHTFSPHEFLTLAHRPADNEVFVIDEVPAIVAVGNKYNAARGQITLDGSEYAYSNKSIPEFLAILDQKEKEARTHYEWIFFDPIWLTHIYANTRQFWPQFTALPENIARPELYARDLRLLNEIFGAMRSGKLTDRDVIKAHKLAWNFAYFDQENTYPLAYNGLVLNYLQGLPLHDVDPRAAYYFRTDALRRLAGQGGG